MSWICGGTISGNCAIGRPQHGDQPPISTVSDRDHDRDDGAMVSKNSDTLSLAVLLAGGSAASTQFLLPSDMAR